ncbi:hypothetical protein DWB58_12985 [candidate division KSB1 bacterium]|nr:hypothetical protein [candidate division KSB1 bacterium]
MLQRRQCMNTLDGGQSCDDWRTSQSAGKILRSASQNAKAVTGELPAALTILKLYSRKQRGLSV